jgi:cysteinyl-tRNA synthetase
MLDLDAHTATVVGKGVISIRLRGTTTEIASGEVFSIDRLRNPWSDVVTSIVAVTEPVAAAVVEMADSNLRQATDRLNIAFQAAIDNADADAAARAALELDDAIAGWSIDTLQSSDADYARSVLRSMVTRLAGAATGGLRDPREVVGPFVQILLDLRAQVRSDKRFDLSDLIRDRFAEINVEVRDTPQGVEWGFRQED